MIWASRRSNNRRGMARNSGAKFCRRRGVPPDDAGPVPPSVAELQWAVAADPGARVLSGPMGFAGSIVGEAGPPKVTPTLDLDPQIHRKSQRIEGAPERGARSHLRSFDRRPASADRTTDAAQGFRHVRRIRLRTAGSRQSNLPVRTTRRKCRFRAPPTGPGGNQGR